MPLLTCSRLIATNVVLDIALLETYKEGIEIRYADGFKRRCYPVLAGLMVDYEEQVLITGVKANMQCSICHVPPKEREYVTKSWEFRTHKSTWEQIERQRNNPAIQRDRAADEWLHPRKCFAWDHSDVNIHAICNNVTFGAESSQSRSHMTTTNYNLTPSSLTSITLLGSSSSTPLSRWRSVPPHLPQSRWQVYLQVGRLFRCNGRISGMIQDDEGE